MHKKYLLYTLPFFSCICVQAQLVKNILANDTKIESYKDFNCNLHFKNNVLTKYINIDSSVEYDFENKIIKINLIIDSTGGKKCNQIFLKFNKNIELIFNNVSYRLDSLLKHTNQYSTVWASKTAYKIEQVLSFSFGAFGAKMDGDEIAYVFFRTPKSRGRIATQKWASNDNSLLDYTEESNIYRDKNEYTIAIHDCNNIKGQSIYYYDYNLKDGLFFNQSCLKDKYGSIVVFSARFPLSVDTAIIPYSTNVLFPFNSNKTIKKNAAFLSRDCYLKSYYALVVTGMRYAYGTPYLNFLLNKEGSTRELYGL